MHYGRAPTGYKLSVGVLDAEGALLEKNARELFQETLLGLNADVLVVNAVYPYDKLGDPTCQPMARHLRGSLGYTIGKLVRQPLEDGQGCSSFGIWSRVGGEEYGKYPVGVEYAQKYPSGVRLTIPNVGDGVTVFGVAFPEDEAAQLAAAHDTLAEWSRLGGGNAVVMGLCRAVRQARPRRGIRRRSAAPLVESKAVQLFAREGFRNADPDPQPIIGKGVEVVPALGILLSRHVHMQPEDLQCHERAPLGDGQLTQRAPLSAMVDLGERFT